MSVRHRVPTSLLGPLGAASLLVGIAGCVTGFIFTLLGITLYFDLNGKPVTDTESMVVVGTGLVCFAAAYVGWRGFMAFAA